MAARRRGRGTAERTAQRGPDERQRVLPPRLGRIDAGGRRGEGLRRAAVAPRAGRPHPAGRRGPVVGRSRRRSGLCGGHPGTPGASRRHHRGLSRPRSDRAHPLRRREGGADRRPRERGPRAGTHRRGTGTGRHHGVPAISRRGRPRPPGERDRPGRDPDRPHRRLRRDRHHTARRHRPHRRDHPDLRLPQPVPVADPPGRGGHGPLRGQRHRLRPREERDPRPQRPEPGHPHRARLRRRDGLCPAHGRPVPGGTAPLPAPHRCDEGRLARRGRTDPGERRDRHHRAALPAAERTQLQPIARPGRRCRHHRRARGHADLPPGAPGHPEHRAADPGLPRPHRDRPGPGTLHRRPARPVRRRRRTPRRRHHRRVARVRGDAHPTPRVGPLQPDRLPARPMGLLASSSARGRGGRTTVRPVVAARRRDRPAPADDMGGHRRGTARPGRVHGDPQGGRHHDHRGLRRAHRLRDRAGTARRPLPRRPGDSGDHPGQRGTGRRPWPKRRPAHRESPG